jgi:D-alanyl-D-alanine carboxypeptidase
VGDFETAVGVANLDTGRPVSLTERFEIGSVTKTFTATLVLQLVERGKLHLNDRLSEYVRGVPHGDEITIRELLNHTSGIHNYPHGLLDAVLRHPHRTFRPAQLVRRSVRWKRYCPPGDCWVYSNTNYILLGQIIKRVTHQPIAQLYERRIFDPLGMDDTTFMPRRRPVPEPAAHGYIRDPAGRKDVTDWNLSWGWTAGGAASTLADLRRWAPALATGRGVLSERMQDKRLQFVPIPGEAGDGYGLGILKLPGGPFGDLLGHDGQPLGYDSYVFYAPSTRVASAALGNTSSSQNPVVRTPFDGDSMFQLGANMLEVIGP